MPRNQSQQTSAIIELIEALGYKVSCRRGNGMVELHAMLLADPTPANTHVVRNHDGDSDEDLYQAAWTMAEIVGIEIEG